MNKFFAKTHNGELSYTVEEHCKHAGIFAQIVIKNIKKGHMIKNLPILAALHDIGKNSSGFQNRLRGDKGKGAMYDHTQHGYELLEKIEDKEIPEGCCSVNGFSFAKIVALCHHGTHQRDKIPPPLAAPYGKENIRACEELFKKMEEHFGSLNSVKEDFERIKSESAERSGKIESIMQTVYIGGVMLCDHLSSSMDYFPSEEDQMKEIDRIAKDAGLKSKYKPVKGLSFEQVCSNTPRGLQKYVSDFDINNCHTFVIKDDMGSGKTKLAMYLAYRIWTERDMDGIYFAFPTRTTSSRAYDEVNDCIKNMLGNKNYKSKLIHSKAAMDEKAVVSDWYKSNKHKIFYTTGTGVVDYISMSSLRGAKDKNLLFFGLHKKVIIVDEAHCYDVYTNEILTNALNALRSAGCVVIILSATLTKNAVNKFLWKDECKIDRVHYPSITGAYDDGTVKEVVAPQGEQKTVKISRVNYLSDAVEECIRRAKNGQQVAIIVNKILTSQSVYAMIKNRDKDIPVGLIHSKFTQTDRAEIEREWLDILGKQTAPEEPKKSFFKRLIQRIMNFFRKKECKKVSKRSETGRILVGTQAIEQSLNFDVDFMVSMIAPIDLILQRSGRLWRFKDTERPKDAKCELMVVMYEDCKEGNKEGKRFVYENGFSIYGKYYCERTRRLLRQINTINCPKDNTDLCEYVYRDYKNNEDSSEYESDTYLGYGFKDNNFLRKIYGETKTAEANMITNATNGIFCDEKNPKDENESSLDADDDTVEDQKRGTRFSLPNATILLVKEIKQMGNGVYIEFADGNKVTLEPGVKDFNNTRLKGFFDKNCINVLKSKAPKGKNYCTQKIAKMIRRYIFLPKMKNESDGNVYDLSRFFIFKVGEAANYEVYHDELGYISKEEIKNIHFVKKSHFSE